MSESAASLRSQHQRPEGKLIEHATRVKRLSARQAAAKAGISDGRWRQIVNGYTSPGGGQIVPVRGPDETIARMARIVGVSPNQLREAGRSEAADLLIALEGMEAENEWRSVGTAIERLTRINDELQAVIRDLQRDNEPGS